MLLGTKMLTIAVGSVFITAATGLWIQRTVIRQQGFAMTRDGMRGTVLSAENARRSISNMRRLGVFDDRRLKADALQQSDYKQTDIFRTVPIVAAFDSIAQVSSKEGYEFRVAAHQPRDAANTRREDE